MHIANFVLIAVAMIVASFSVPADDDEKTQAKPPVVVELIVPDQLNDNSKL